MTTPVAGPTEGVGCRGLATAVGALLAFAVVAVTIGLTIILGDEPSPAAEVIGLTAYAAGAPVSGLFAALAGDLPLTLYLDALAWILAGAWLARLVERGRGLARLVVLAIVLALFYGAGVASLIELA